MNASVMEDSGVFRGGFADPVFNAQAVFRGVMDALARPGTVQPIAAFTDPPAPLSQTAGAIAATLFDHDTHIWLDPMLAGANAVAGWLTFHTAAPLAAQPIDADFALVGGPGGMPSLESFSQGTQEYPDRSTTLILQIEALEDGPPLRLAGPGIKESAIIMPVGMPVHFEEQWAANNARFPRGVDVLLAAPGGVVGLPRTTRIESGAEI